MERLPDELSARVLCMVGIERERRVASMACRAFTSFASRGLLDCRLVRIRVRTGNLVDRIRLEFDDGAVQDFAGGIGGIEREPFDIAPGDALVGIQCRAGDNLDAIQFRTRRGHLSRFYGNIHGGRSVPTLYRPHGIRGLYVKARAYGDDYNCYYSQTILTRILNAFERPTSSLKIENILSPRRFSGYHVTGLTGPLRRNWERFPPLAAEFTERDPEGSRRTHRMGTRGNPRRSVDDDSDDESAVQSDWSSESDY